MLKEPAPQQYQFEMVTDITAQINTSAQGVKTGINALKTRICKK